MQEPADSSVKPHGILEYKESIIAFKSNNRLEVLYFREKTS